MKKYLVLLLIGFVALFGVNSIKAETTTSTTSGETVNHDKSNSSFFDVNEINQLIREASTSANRSQAQLQNIIKAADMMISNRIATLNTLSARISGDSRLTDAEKTSLTGDVNTAISGLTTLKTKIDADTDAATAKSDTKQIVTNFRIYEELEPKLRMLITLNNLQMTTANIQNLIPQVQNIITLLAGQGKDVSGLNSLIGDINSQLTSINTTIANDINTLNALTPTSTNIDATIAQIKNDLTTIVKTDFAKIRTDFGQMRTLFRQLILGTSPSPSVVPTTTP